MAWISVHEDIIGGKLRELSKSLGCSQNESIGILIRLWLWCINNADKDGRIIGANQDDLAEILNIGKSKEIEADDIVNLNAKALPENFNQSRFVLNCISLIKSNLSNYNNITPESVYLALAKGAYLGLDFFNGECYAIPYSGEVNFQTDYKGEIKLAKTYSRNPIKDIYAKNVRKGDFFEEIIESGKQSVNFRPVPFSDEVIIGTFAVVLFKDGSMMYDTMSVKEIEEVRNNFSKAKNSKAWAATPGEMYKKTVLRRLCKLIDLDFNSQQRLAYEDAGDFDKEKANEPVADDTVNVFDTEFKEVEPEDKDAAIIEEMGLEEA